jgi:hypothetical protein
MKFHFRYPRSASLAAGMLMLMSTAALSQQTASKLVQKEQQKAVAPVAKTETKTKVETKKRPVAVAKVARNVRANDDAQINALIGQYSPQFRQILRAEFQVVRVVCNPTPDQSKRAARHVEKSFKSAVRKYAEGMRRPMTADQRTALDPHKIIRETVLQAVLTQLTSEQAGRYHEELAHHADYCKQLAIRNLVVKLDRELILDGNQREKLADSLKLNWSDSWNQSPNSLVYDNAFLPNLPDKAVALLLNETQLKIWRGIPKNNGFFNQFVMEQANNDDPLEDPDLRDARVAEAAEGDKNGK